MPSRAGYIDPAGTRREQSTRPIGLVRLHQPAARKRLSQTTDHAPNRCHVGVFVQLSNAASGNSEPTKWFADRPKRLLN